MNAGIVALGANLGVALAVTYAGPREHDERPDDEVLARDEIGDPEREAEPEREADPEREAESDGEPAGTGH